MEKRENQRVMLTRRLIQESLTRLLARESIHKVSIRSLCEEAHLFVWDEPLNYIDLFSRLQFEQLLQQQSAAMLFVEHDAAFCQTVATRILTVARRKQA